MFIITNIKKNSSQQNVVQLQIIPKGYVYQNYIKYNVHGKLHKAFIISYINGWTLNFQ